jgi:lysophospholipase L1-like esterase
MRRVQGAALLGVIAACLLTGTAAAAPASAEEASACPGVVTSEARGLPSSKARAETAARLAADTPLLVLGDSIAWRWPDADLRSVFGAAPVKLAVGGDRIEHTRWILGHVPSGVRPRAVLIVAGTNNVNHDGGCEFQAKLEALLTEVRAKFPEARIYEMNITPKGVGRRAFLARIQSANQTIRQAAARHGIISFDGYKALETACEAQSAQECPLYEPDRLHPNAGGYRPLTAALADAVKQTER